MKKVSILVFFAVCVGRILAAGLPFIQDNYGEAISQGRQRKLPIFVEVWAPW
jgi:hypothetical protein